MRNALLLSLTFAAPGLALRAADFQITNPAEFRQCVPADAKVTKLAGDFTFTEGPTWIKAGGFLVFSDIPKDELKQWKPAGGTTTYRQPSHNANGNTTDPDGRLHRCLVSAKGMLPIVAGIAAGLHATGFCGRGSA
jgi:gluconolactonase